jgi:hypothetical protein
MFSGAVRYSTEPIIRNMVENQTAMKISGNRATQAVNNPNRILIGLLILIILS